MTEMRALLDGTIFSIPWNIDFSGNIRCLSICWAARANTSRVASSRRLVDQLVDDGLDDECPCGRGDRVRI
jgi:hypothetical protein